MNSKPGRYCVFGTAWRANYFLRLASLLPDRLEVAGVMGRDRAKTDQFAARWGVPAFDSVDVMVKRARPDFVVICVPRTNAPTLTREAVELKLPVLCETPPALDVASLHELWADVGESGLVQVSEQYPLMPSHAARLALARSGAIGKVTSVQVSSTHIYHAVALMRAYLDEGYGPATISARDFVAPLVNPLVRDAWTDDDEAHDAKTTIATIDFGGTMGLYDFTANQWHNQLRSRRIVIRGSAGEIANDEVVRLTAPRTIVRSPLLRRQTGYDLDLDGFDTDHISLGDTILYRNPFPGLRLNDEEIAIGSMLVAMSRWCRGEGPAPYPLAEACQNHLLGLAIERSAELGEAVTTAVAPWAPERT